MCGIAGILGREQWEPIDRLPLERLCHSLYHRGPDYQDIWSQPGIGLIHTRLSIIDLNPRSHQPMVNPENDQVIVFNGEIYNYLELRSELETLGYHFQTFSDTEVILKAYAHWREACLSRFNGMWAFAIYDPKTGSLFCSRDRYGVKPFVYGFNDQNQFVFGIIP